MNLLNKSATDLLFVNFNQDYSCVSVGTRSGYRIYNCDPFGKCYGKTDGGIGIVEMLFCTSLVALVGAGEQPAFSPRRLQITNTKRQSTIVELTFVTSILAVKLNRKRLIVVLEEHIYIYDISNMKLLHTIDTNPNVIAICALSPSSDNCYVAYPPITTNSSAITTQGQLLLFDALNLQAVNIIQAHKSPLSCVSFNYDGTLVATSSDKGTVIRVFSVPTGQKVYQFRRGTYPARIYSISFNLASTLLAVSSDTDTIHIYKLEEDKKEDKRATFSNLATSVGAMILPGSVQEIWEPQRDFAFAKIRVAKGDKVMNICGLAVTNPMLLVATSEGYFYQYSVDIENGGECVLTKQFSFVNDEES